MRGRKPHQLSLAAPDRAVLEQIARSRTLPWFQVQRARALLGLAGGERVQTLAWQLQCSPSTLWRLARRYEHAGPGPILVDAPRRGRPADISPCAARAGRATGLPGAHR